MSPSVLAEDPIGCDTLVMTSEGPHIRFCPAHEALPRPAWWEEDVECYCRVEYADGLGLFIVYCAQHGARRGA